MRVIPPFEKKKRGCIYCQDMQLTRNKGVKRCGCPHDECPFNVLDKYDTYEQFMASEDSKIMVDGFFHTVASCYELANENAKTFSVYRDACNTRLNF